MPDQNVTDTLILPDGRELAPDGKLLDPSMGIVTEVESSKNAVALVTKMKRNLGDMPDIPKNMNPVCCVLTYSSIGLSNADIATALSTTEDNIIALKESDLYSQIEKMFDERVFDDEVRTARHIISKHAHNAAAKVVSLIDSKSGDLALAASLNTLRIGGVDKTAVAAGLSALKIVLVDDDDRKKTQIDISLGD